MNDRPNRKGAQEPGGERPVAEVHDRAEPREGVVGDDRWHHGGENLTVVGHTAREALQLFASELIELHDVSDAPTDPTKTVARARGPPGTS